MLLNFSLSPKIYLPFIYVAVAFLAYMILSKIVDKALVINKNIGKKNEFQKKREKTIIDLIKNVIKYLILILTLIAILNVYGVQTTSIIASLGILATILGLAMQDTIKNFLKGIIIIFDNEYVQGDIVTINGFKGEVVSLGLQTTKIKCYTGEVMIIDNSSITSVINHSMYNTKLVIELPIVKELSIEKIENILKRVLKKIENMSEVKDSSMLGIESLEANRYIYKIEIDCKPNNQYGVNREFMKLLKKEYENEGIRVPNELLEIQESKHF